MTEWTVVGVPVTLVGLVAAVIKLLQLHDHETRLTVIQ